MKTYKKSVINYKKSQIDTADQKTLIIMMYDGAINFLAQGRSAIKDNNVEATHNNLLKAQNIVNELMVSLNIDAGGQIAANLQRLYFFIIENICKANMNKDEGSIKMIDNCSYLLKTLRDAWTHLDQNKKNKDSKADYSEDSSGSRNESKVENNKNLEVTYG